MAERGEGPDRSAPGARPALRGTDGAPGVDENGAQGLGRLARLPTPAGLCAACVHLRLAVSPRSVFVRCGLADDDPRYPRYPPLPVLECEGYDRT